MKQLINVDPEAKVKALSTITQSLDVLSTCRVTSFTLTKNQFAELLAMYLTKNASTVLVSHFPDFKENTCEKCVVPEVAGEPENEKPQFDPTTLALKILNRCFTYQIEAIILN